MSDGNAHAAANAAQLRLAERERSTSLVESHNTLVAAVELARADFDGAFLDDAQTDAVGDALDQLEAVANSIRDDDFVLDERLLATWEAGDD